VTEEKEEKVLLRSSGESLLYSGGKDSPQLTPLPDPRSASAALANETTNGIPFSSILLLNLVAILWGTQHAVIKSVLTGWDGGSGFAAGSSIAGPHVDPAVFTFARFTVAAAAATLGNIFASSRSAPSAGSTVTTAQKAGSEGNRGGRGENKDGVKPASLASALRWGAEMGSWMFLGFAFQAVGLQYTTASKSGFLLYLNVKLVPLLAFVFLGRPLTVTTAASALTAFAGTFLLATSGCAAVAGDGSDVGGWNVGDAWSVAAALASAMFILRLERASAEVPNASSLNACCLWTVALFSGLWTAVPSMIAIQSIQDPGGTTGCLAPILPLLHDAANLIESRGWEIAYLSVVTTALANWIQAKGQRDVPAERASVLYAMDPVYGAIFAHLWLGENLEGPSAWVGAALITVAAVTSALLDVPPEKCRPREEPSPSSSSRRREL
jgi:drug/metabolite transporter (DMT)-like permease